AVVPFTTTWPLAPGTSSLLVQISWFMPEKPVVDGSAAITMSRWAWGLLPGPDELTTIRTFQHWMKVVIKVKAGRTFPTSERGQGRSREAGTGQGSMSVNAGRTPSLVECGRRRLEGVDSETGATVTRGGAPRGVRPAKGVVKVNWLKVTLMLQRPPSTAGGGGGG